MVGLHILSAPSLQARPGGKRLTPERIAGRKSQSEEARCAQISAARIDIRLGHVDLAACKADAQPSLFVERLGSSKLAGDDSCQRATHLGRRNRLRQFMNQRRMSHRMEGTHTIDNGAAHNRIGSFGRNHTLLLFGIACETLHLHGQELFRTLYLVLGHDAQHICQHRMNHEAVVVVGMILGAVAIDTVAHIPLVTEGIHAIHQALHVTLAGKLQQSGFDHRSKQQPVVVEGLDATRTLQLRNHAFARRFIHTSPQLLGSTQQALSQESSIDQGLRRRTKIKVIGR